MPYSEFENKVIAAADHFCRNCDNLDVNMQFPAAPGQAFGKRCNILLMAGMVERHERGLCALAMVDGVAGTMTLECFEPEESKEATG